ncbi:MAG: hypothetical protein QF486_06350 [Candidatus Woesearchaeota archaeon]|jgi:protein-L-isoaspartate O-methyltransferase|nr:hypothetical protein [Candidatus Woesearchaeota archaeon]MDP7181892.1 hypothetical protein [Candidatus Woesearchaeota archaeon]MDP7199207.1 hypothetical protein [Candidatus Woesearchaeota archaeon]MDP7467820.1 hypothetical protein [Candidatus Woesearchaeota archaeon]MDP7647810.1 hypothetical protein [Candidatus Woesearchaeota archaeon]
MGGTFSEGDLVGCMFSWYDLVVGIPTHELYDHALLPIRDEKMKARFEEDPDASVFNVPLNSKEDAAESLTETSRFFWTEVIGKHVDRSTLDYGLPSRVFRLLSDEKMWIEGGSLHSAIHKTDRAHHVTWMEKEFFESYKYTDEEFARLIDAGLMEQKEDEYREQPYLRDNALIDPWHCCYPAYLTAATTALSHLPGKVERIFEWGSGRGFQMANFARAHPNAQVVGADRNEIMRALFRLARAGYQDDALNARMDTDLGDYQNPDTSAIWQGGAPWPVISFSFAPDNPQHLELMAQSDKLADPGVIIAPVWDPTVPDNGAFYLTAFYKENDQVSICRVAPSSRFEHMVTD